MKSLTLLIFLVVNILIVSSENETVSNVTEAKLSSRISSTTTFKPSTESTSTPTNNTPAASALSFFSSTLDTLRKFFFSPSQQQSTADKRQSAKLQSRNSQQRTEQKPEKNDTIITKRMNVEVIEEELFCPEEKEATFELFPTICSSNQECEKLGQKFRCCKLFGSKRCHEGLAKPLTDDLHHEPLFGIPRKCPTEPLAESFWDVKKCDQDTDCDFPRICCPSARKRYCMTSYTEPEHLPVARQIAYPVESIAQYFQCTPPPPPTFDRHPKPCNSSLTCFPNICCLEGGKKHCRPPKKNILAALTTFSQRFNVGWIRDWSDNLVIRR